MNLDLTAICKTREPRPLIYDAARTFSFEIHVDVLELFEKLQQNLDSRLDPPGRHAQRRRSIADVGRKRFVIRIHADADDHVPHEIDLGLDLRKDSAELLPADEQIIWPFDVDVHAGIALYSIMHGNSGTEREQGCETRRRFWKQHQREIDSGFTLRMPASAKPAAARSL